jgi:hypothetical protein
MPQAFPHETKQKQNNKRKPHTSTIPSLNKGNLENNHVQKGIRLGVPWSRLVGSVRLCSGDR